MHSSQETDKGMFCVRISWNENPLIPFLADFVSTPSAKAALAPDSLSLTQGHTDPFCFPDDLSLLGQQATGQGARTFKGFHLRPHVFSP